MNLKNWKTNSTTNYLGIKLPIIQAPMAGANGSAMAVAVARAGGLGSLPCAMLTSEQIEKEVITFRSQTSAPINLNFFCHQNPKTDEARAKKWKDNFLNYYHELGIDPEIKVDAPKRKSFDAELCELVLKIKPEIISFHFGLPDASLIKKIKNEGIKILSSATTVDEALYLESNGCNIIIAQGLEAGGHRGQFLDQDINTQVGTMALIPQIVNAVKIPVIASGGISDARGIIASFVLGASAVQIGTAFLFSNEATISPLHKLALKKAKDNSTVLTNIFSGKPARGILNRVVKEKGPMNYDAPEFPLAGEVLAPLRKVSESNNSSDFMSLWSGQAAALCDSDSAENIVKNLEKEVEHLIAELIN